MEEQIVILKASQNKLVSDLFISEGMVLSESLKTTCWKVFLNIIHLVLGNLLHLTVNKSGKLKGKP